MNVLDSRRAGLSDSCGTYGVEKILAWSLRMDGLCVDEALLDFLPKSPFVRFNSAELVRRCWRERGVAGRWFEGGPSGTRKLTVCGKNLCC